MIITRRLRVTRTPGRFVWSLILAGACAFTVQAQPPFGATDAQGCKTNIAELLQYKIREVKVKARYLPQIALPSPGEPYTAEKETEVLERVQQAFQSERNREDVEGATEFQVLETMTVGKDDAVGRATANLPAFRVRAYTTCKKPVKEADCKSSLGEANGKCIDLIVQVRSFRFDPNNPWQDLLPTSRTDKPTFVSNVPSALRTLNPQFGLDHDREFGPAQEIKVSTNLLDLNKNLQGQPLKVQKTRMDLEAGGRKSLSEPYYNIATKLSVSHKLGRLVDSIALEAGLVASHEPRGEGSYLKNAATFGGDVSLRTSFEPLRNITFGGRYRWATNRFGNARSGVSEMTSEDGAEARLLVDGRLRLGFLRMALWFDTAKPEIAASRYRRLAGMVGYEKEFPVALNQTIGVEFILGGGRAWGSVPEYARFYGGNLAKNLIYEPRDSTVLTSFPAGPLMRSFGSGQAAERTGGGAILGGTSYAHLNLNVSIPISRWSYPLIPNIDIGVPQIGADGNPILDEDGNETEINRPLKEVVKLQAENSRRIMTRIFVKQGLSQQEAEAKAEKELGGIRTLVGFLADQANIYSVKPLFMFDAARLDSPTPADSRTKIAVGGGLQLTVVVARFEAGYMRSVRRAPGDDKGNFVMRLVFQNLF